jgi:hypothetical protein
MLDFRMAGSFGQRFPRPLLNESVLGHRELFALGRRIFDGEGPGLACDDLTVLLVGIRLDVSLRGGPHGHMFHIRAAGAVTSPPEGRGRS